MHLHMYGNGFEYFSFWGGVFGLQSTARNYSTQKGNRFIFLREKNYEFWHHLLENDRKRQ